MSIKQSHKPDGYKELLIYKKAHGLLLATTHLTEQFPESKTMDELADQMNRSARSVKQNIVEGWKRNTTRQYNEFLGFAIASAAELKEDCEDIWTGAYRELLDKRGIMGEMEVKREERDGKGRMGETGENGEKMENEKAERVKWLEPLKFYPLDETLPPVVRLYLRSKEVCFLIDKTQQSLQKKMIEEHGLTQAEKQTMKEKEDKENSNYVDSLLAEKGQVMTTRGIMTEDEAQQRNVKIIRRPYE